MFLFVGGDSEIGSAAERLLRDQGLAVVTTTRRPSQVRPGCSFLDLSAPLDGWTPPVGITSACILAGINRITDCAADPAGTAFINVDQSLAVTDRLLARGASVLFISTNQVFDGSRVNVPPEAPTCPVSTYGQQNARAEAALRERSAAGLPIAILRITKVVSPKMALLQGWSNALARGAAVQAFEDMAMAPVPMAMAAGAVAALLRARATGIFQLSGPRDVSYADVARQLARRLGAGENLIEPVSVRSAALPIGSAPPHTTLDSTRMREFCGLAVPDASDTLETTFAYVDLLGAVRGNVVPTPGHPDSMATEEKAS
jgi:dTDP-4-dehydrorhamnose reductase